MAAKLEALSAGLLNSRRRGLSIESKRREFVAANGVRRAASCVATFAPASP